MIKHTVGFNGLICSMIGSNDVYKKEAVTNELIDKYRNLIKTMKEKSDNVLCLGILPRSFLGFKFSSKAIYFNARLEEICKAENVSFANFWESFDNHKYLFRKDGVHLNDVGDARLGRLLDSEIKKIHKEKMYKKQVFREGQNRTLTIAN